MKKMVNGLLVDMGADEIAQRQAEDAAFEAAKANLTPPEKTAREEIEAIKTRLAALEQR